MSFSHQATDFSRINRFIYIGTNFCCTEHFSSKLLKEGIEADISLENTRVDSPFGVKHYLWLPVKDHMPPSPLQFKIGVATITYLVRARKKVYVHCARGHGRAPTLVAAYLITQGMEVEEALRFLKLKRPEIHPSPFQLKALKQLRRNLHTITA